MKEESLEFYRLSRYEALLMHKILQFAKIYPEGASTAGLKKALEEHGKAKSENMDKLDSEEKIKETIIGINNTYFNILGIQPVIVDIEGRYHLHPENIVTRYLTAKMLIELRHVHKISKESEHLKNINRVNIEDYIQKRPWFQKSIYGGNGGPYAEKFIKEKFDWFLSSAAQYLHPSNRRANHCVVTKRIEFELQYIALLYAFVHSEVEVKVQTSPTELEAIEKVAKDTYLEDIPQEELKKIIPGEEPKQGDSQELKNLKEEIKKFHKELCHADEMPNNDLYRLYNTWQIFGEAIQKQIARRVFKNEDIEKAGVHVATRSKDKKVRKYIEFRGKGESGKLYQKSIGRKDELEKEAGVDFAAELDKLEKE